MKIVFKKQSILILLAIVFLSFLVLLSFLNLPTEGIYYWLLLIYWINFVVILKKDSSFSLKLALILFITSALIYLIGFINIAEIIMRTFFIGLTIGLPQAFIEYLEVSKIQDK